GFFFFQAEDGIRDFHVTGVQTCALPIYLLNQWESLVAHTRLGRTEIDNNLVENAIRPSAIGKKNWLFIGHPEAGDRSAILYSIKIGRASCRERVEIAVVGGRL